MSYEVSVSGAARRTVHRLLSDVIGADAVVASGDAVVLSVVDQSAMVGLVTHLNDLGLHIDRVERTV